MSGTFRPIPRYPAVLGARIAQADQLARALQSLWSESMPSDPSFLWLMGRADEVRTFADEIAREWAAGTIEIDGACEAIRGYVGAVHVALHRRYGGYGASSCCGPHLEPFARSNAADGAMREQLKSGVLELGDPPPPSRSRPRLRGGPVSTHKQVAIASPRRRQAG